MLSTAGQQLHPCKAMTRIKLLLVCAAALVVLFVAEANAAGRLVEKPLVWPGQVQQ